MALHTVHALQQHTVPKVTACASCALAMLSTSIVMPQNLVQDKDYLIQLGRLT